MRGEQDQCLLDLVQVTDEHAPREQRLGQRDAGGVAHGRAQAGAVGAPAQQSDRLVERLRVGSVRAVAVQLAGAQHEPGLVLAAAAHGETN
ncbi:hypothetical protein [Micromonospora sp. ATCC 39149]|uniref:hypothetical protein n=1 Tax=Micromonospora sp. (strain ATCC 39149 / NRRL 15099 / SCC 1413) TaxID=219305 RepID=UPI00055F301E|nr:hypothetical protein [Micromonospora sp. ATCC 39149]